MAGCAYKKLMEVFQANFLRAIETWGNFAEGKRGWEKVDMIKNEFRAKGEWLSGRGNADRTILLHIKKNIF